MAVVQENKGMRPVLDYHELNEYADTHTAGPNMCTEVERVAAGRICFYP